MDAGLNQLLKWGVENSSTAQTSSDTPSDPNAPQDAPPQHSARDLNPDALAALLGGPSDAELLVESMTAIQTSSVSLADKLVAFDNFEQLVESIDNANNLGPLNLWTPLIAQLSATEHELRMMAAWCVGTSVQNNIKAQERLVAVNGIAPLVKLVLEDKEQSVRRKAVYALSSAVRNYQPALDELIGLLPESALGDKKGEKVEAGDMESINSIMSKLREGKA
ncbi:MAG: hsp70 nucleotide exchange factor fes1 [Vezdaea acicularis]|nr:MAG: hsp70 nucleotide exchange factor fes1 [Vezdaea acicularis]